MIELTIVRENLMNEQGYTSYCGNILSRNIVGGCSNPRTVWSKEKEQFVCNECGWVSKFPINFIERYKKKYK